MLTMVTGYVQGWGGAFSPRRTASPAYTVSVRTTIQLSKTTTARRYNIGSPRPLAIRLGGAKPLPGSTRLELNSVCTKFCH